MDDATRKFFKKIVKHMLKGEISEVPKDWKKYENEEGQWAVDATKKYGKKYGFDVKGGNTHNNEGDAFKHGYLQGGYAKISPMLAHIIGDRHESPSGQPSGEKNMDLWNNAIGRKYAEEVKNEIRKEKGGFHPILNKNDVSTFDDKLAEKLNKAIKNGEMITNPNDKRVYKKTDLAEIANNVYNTIKGSVNDYDDNINMILPAYANVLKKKFLPGLDEDSLQKNVKILDKKNRDNSALKKINTSVKNQINNLKDNVGQNINNGYNKINDFNNNVEQKFNSFKNQKSLNDFSNEELSHNNRVFYDGEINVAKTKRDDLVPHVLEQYWSNDKKLPSKDDLDKSVADGELFYVEDYPTENGLISGYYRRKKRRFL